MKKHLIIIFVILLIPFIVKAEMATVRILIPRDYKVDIKTEKFNYVGINLNKNIISIDKVINNFEDRYISITVGLFDKNKKNIGMLYYCSKYYDKTIIRTNEELPVKIKIDGTYLKEKTTYKDVKYIAIMDENSSCRKTRNDEYYGKELSEIIIKRKSVFDAKVEVLKKVLTVTFAVILGNILYNGIFLERFENINGDDLRRAYRKYTRLKKEQKEKNKDKDK